MRLMLCLLGMALAAWAQAVSTSQVSGTVQDASGAAVGGAAVRVIQTATGQVREATTADDGSYLFPSLAIGPYRLEISKPGFFVYVKERLQGFEPRPGKGPPLFAA